MTELSITVTDRFGNVETSRCRIETLPPVTVLRRISTDWSDLNEASIPPLMVESVIERRATSLAYTPPLMIESVIKTELPPPETPFRLNLISRNDTSSDPLALT